MKTEPLFSKQNSNRHSLLSGCFSQDCFVGERYTRNHCEKLATPLCRKLSLLTANSFNLYETSRWIFGPKLIGEYFALIQLGLTETSRNHFSQFTKQTEMTWIVHRVFKLDKKLWVYGITTDNTGNIYFTSGDYGLWKLNTIHNSVTQLINDKTYHMLGITYDNVTNTLYTCNWGHSILQYQIEKRELSVLTGKSTQGCNDGLLGRATFCYPVGITIDSTRNLYVTESSKIRKIQLGKGVVSTVAGCRSGFAYKTASVDGQALEATFNTLSGIAMDKDGSIYSMDGGFLRKVNQGLVETVDRTFSGALGLVPDLAGNLFITANTGIWKVQLSPFRKTFLAKITDLKNITLDKKGFLYVGSREIIVLQKSWNLERWLWVGKLKENSMSCQLAKLPRDLLQEITSYLRFCDLHQVEAARTTVKDTSVSFGVVMAIVQQEEAAESDDDAEEI